MLAATSSQGGEASSSTLRLPSVSSQSQACSLLTCAVQHLFFAKGQVYEPIAVLQAKRAREKLADSQRREGLLASGANVGSRRKSDSLVKRQRTRKVDEVREWEKMKSRKCYGRQKRLIYLTLDSSCSRSSD